MSDDLLCLMLLDTVTGRILHTQCHESGDGPVSTAFYGNVGVMIFADKMSLTRLAMALELYDHSHPKMDVRTILGVPLRVVKAHVSCV